MRADVRLCTLQPADCLARTGKREPLDGLLRFLPKRFKRGREIQPEPLAIPPCPGRQMRSLSAQIVVRDECAHLDVGQRPVLFAVPCDVPLNFVVLSGHDCFFAHAGM